MTERFGLGRVEPRRRDRLQRRLPAPVLRRARHPGARHRAGGQRRRGRGGEKGIPTLVRVLRRRDRDRRSRAERQADLLLGNNVLAHVPDLNDFVGGMKMLLKPGGVITMEFPHLMRLIDEQPVRHDLPRALLLLLVLAPRRQRVRRARPAAVRRRGAADARRLAAHLRLPRRRRGQAATERAARAARARGRRGLRRRSRPTSASARGWSRTSARSSATLIELKREGKRIVGYGAPAKGNTLLNYCGIGTDFLDYTVDLNPHKQGHLLPGTHIPIRAPGRDPRRPARRRADPAVEPQGRDRRAARVHPRVGRQVRGAHAGAHAAAREARPDARCAGAYVVELEPLATSAGCFARTFDAAEFARARTRRPRSRSATPRSTRAAGTLRGLHYQADAARGGASSCAARAARSSTSSSTCGRTRRRYCRWFGVELRGGRRRVLYIPAGFAHGFQTLDDDTEVHYQMAYHYVPEAARGVRWDDPAFGIEWPAAADAHDLRARRHLPRLRAVKRVLVTGAGGFIGRGTLAPLRGARVRGRPQHRETCSQPGAPRAGDRAGRGPTHLLHLAWNAKPGEFWTSPENLDWVAAVAAPAARVRGTAASGRCSPARARSTRGSDETHCVEGTTPLEPATLYGTAKHALHTLVERAGVSAAWGRVFFVFGPHEHPARLASSVASALVRGEPAETVPGHAGARLPLLRGPRRRVRRAAGLGGRGPGQPRLGRSAPDPRARRAARRGGGPAGPAAHRRAAVEPVRARGAHCVASTGCATRSAGTRRARSSSAWPTPSLGGGSASLARRR